MGIFSFLQPKQAQPQLANSNQNQVAQMSLPQNQGRSIGGLLGAIAAGISPTGFSAGQSIRQNQILGGISDPMQRMQRAGQLGRYDLVEQMRAQQENERKAREAAQLEANQKAYMGIIQAQTKPMAQVQPMAQNQPIQAPQMPQMDNQASIPQNFNPNAKLGSADNPETVTTYGQRQIPQSEKVHVNPYSEADLSDKLLQEAIQRHDYKSWQEYTKQAKTLRSGVDTQRNQYMAGLVPAAYGVQDDPKTVNVNEHENAMLDAWSQLENLGFKPDAHLRATLERGGAEGDALLRQLVNQGDLEKAAQGEIERQNKPLVFRDQGGFTGAFNPYNGQAVSQQSKTVDPNTVYSQGQQTRREAMGNAVTIRGQNVSAATAAANRASSQRIANIRASTTMSEGAKNRAISQERINLQRQIAAAGGQTNDWGGDLPSGFVVDGDQ